MKSLLGVDLTGRLALVTGANSGMGKETAREFARMGARVVLGCRAESRGRSAADDIIETTGNGAVSVVRLDLADLQSVASAADGFLRRIGPLDILVNNAAASVQTRELTEEGFERHWATNVLGPYLLTTRLLPALHASSHGRIVNVSTVAAGGLNLQDPQYERRRFNGTGAYRASKQAARMLAWSLADRLRADAVTVNCVNPGYVLTDLTRNAGGLVKALVALTKPFAQTPGDGADCAIWAATSPDVAGMSGKFWNKRREIDCRFRDPGPRAQLQALVEQQLAAVSLAPV